jgi:hypothetical protein
MRLLRLALAGGRGLVPALLIALAIAPRALAAQTDVIRGKVTAADGRPLSGVRVTATSIPGNVTREGRSQANGSYQVVFPGGTGDYIMGFALVGYGFRQFEIKRVADEAILVADARLAPIMLDTVAIVAAAAPQRVARGIPGLGNDAMGTDQAIIPGALPPELMGNLAAMAASLPGVLLLPGIDGGPDGFSVYGLGADQNSMTLNGMDNGASNLPRDASISTSLSTSSYDVSRGGFSGGNLNVTALGGGNQKVRGMSLASTAPQMQWTDRAARSLGNELLRNSLSGKASGPIVLNKSFYNVSFELGRESRNNQSLLSTDALGLRSSGVAFDSVGRMMTLLDGRGIPRFAGPTLENRLADNGSLLGTFDLMPPSSASGATYGVTLNGGWGRTRPAGAGPLALSSSNGDRTNWNAGAQFRHSAYWGMILTETQMGVNASEQYGDPYLRLPAGSVRVNSVFDDGTNGVRSLAFGGNQTLDQHTKSNSASVTNTLSWFDEGNQHRLKLTTEFSYSGNSQDLSSNRLGTFSYNSLADLEANRPSTFSRVLSARVRSTGQQRLSFSLGDTYRRNPDLQFQYGVRLDGSRYTATPAYNPAIEEAFGRRNDIVPTPWAISPRIGFTRTLGQAPMLSAFVGAAPAPRAVVRGGIGLYANGASAGQIGSALDNTGLPTGTQQIYCVGAAAPTPDWAAYLDDLGLVPSTCADGSAGTVFANPSPTVSLISEKFRTPQSLRSNLSWNGSVLDARFTTSVEASYSLNMNQSRTVDLNFRPEARFSLPDEQGRPVFVQTTSIVPTTGAIASRDARVTTAFSRVNDTRSDLTSRSAQLMLRLNPIQRGLNPWRWGVSYTYTNVREQVSGFTSTAGDPTGITWAAGSQGPHQISYNLSHILFNAVTVSWNGSFRSGSGYTPTVGNDINGDGSFNDRAYVFEPATAPDPDVGAQMQQLLDNATPSTRECLLKQVGQIASRNSCRGPWTTQASLNFTLDRVKFRMPSRGSIQFSLQNPLGAADLLMNGSKLKGWGQSPFPDQQLLHVRGFDPATQRFKYEVNQRFGITRPELQTVRQTVMLSATMRWDLGPTRERQDLVQRLAYGRTTPGTKYPASMYRTMSTSTIPNPMVVILRLQDSLKLSSMQADSIASMNRRYTYRVDSLMTPVANYFAALPTDYNDDEAYGRLLAARHAHIDLLNALGPVINKLITPEQRRKLPASTTNMLDFRYLAQIRNGTGLYISGGGGSPFIPSSQMMMMETMMFIR